MSSVVIGSYTSILFIDKILLRNMVPYPKYRPAIFLIKYLLIPTIPYAYARKYF